MGLSDSLQSRRVGYVFPPHVGRFRSRPAGPPRLLIDLSTRAVPYHPGRLSGCTCLLLHQRSCLASSSSADWPPSFSYRGRIGFTCVTARVFASRVLASSITETHARSATC